MLEVDFDQEVLQTFFEFIHERQSIWHRRFIEKRPQPWTTDPVLLKNKFTNIYRELDPGTVFARQEILERDAPSADRVFNIMLYRLMCSIPTYKKLGFQYLESFSLANLQFELGKIYFGGEPVFGNAYLISPYSSMGSPYKYINVSRLFAAIHRDFSGFFERLMKAPSLEKAFKVINSMYGFGPFLAYQVCVDLCYNSSLTGQSILPFSHDDWARLGPGALRGLRRMTKAYSTAQTLDALRWLWENQHGLFDLYAPDFPFLRTDAGLEISITLSNMQNCLCEFHKYMSIWDGSGKAQRLFVPAEERGR